MPAKPKLPSPISIPEGGGKIQIIVSGTIAVKADNTKVIIKRKE